MKWIKQIINIDPFKVTCIWNDNEIREIDLTEFIQSNSKNKNNSYYQLNNKSRFAQVKCDGTTLYWENGIIMKDYDGSEKPGSLDIDPDFLYSISKFIETKLTKEKTL